MKELASLHLGHFGIPEDLIGIVILDVSAVELGGLAGGVVQVIITSGFFFTL